MKLRKYLKAACLTTAMYAGLIWFYIVVRIWAGGFPMGDRFIYDIDISFWQLAIAAFVASAFGTFGYLVLKEEK